MISWFTFLDNSSSSSLSQLLDDDSLWYLSAAFLNELLCCILLVLPLELDTENSFIYKRFLEFGNWLSDDNDENAPDRNLVLCSVLGIVLSFLSTIDNKDTITFLKPFKSVKSWNILKRKTSQENVVIVEKEEKNWGGAKKKPHSSAWHFPGAIFVSWAVT